MPVMNGLEAAREFCKLKCQHREEYERIMQKQEEEEHEKGIINEIQGEGEDPPPPPPPPPAAAAAAAPPPALIVALTGLANGQDQSSALASGMDLSKVKSVKFKEIGRLLDDWFSERDVRAGVRR